MARRVFNFVISEIPLTIRGGVGLDLLKERKLNIPAVAITSPIPVLRGGEGGRRKGEGRGEEGGGGVKRRKRGCREVFTGKGRKWLKE